MALKVVIFYQQGARGWTETYYAPGSTPAAFSQQYINYNSMIPFLALRANDVILTEVRVSLVGSPRVTYSTPFSQESINAQGEDSDAYNQDTYGEDALILVRSAGGLPRHVWIRGLPNIFISYGNSGDPQPPAELLSNIQAWGSQLVSMGLQIQNLQLPAPTSSSWYNVTYVENGPTGGQPNSVLLCPSIPPLSPPYGPLYFQGVPRNNLPGFPRIITPGVITAGTPLNSVYVPYLFRGSSAQVYPGKMKFTPLIYTYNSITSVAFATYGTRKTGRPTGLPRGRVSVVIRRQ